MNAIELHAWNAANQRAAEEYAEHPFAACMWPDCPELSPIDAGFCPEHANHVGLCARCQSRKRKAGESCCWTCRYSGNELAAARMRRRRRGGVA